MVPPGRHDGPQVRVERKRGRRFFFLSAFFFFFEMKKKIKETEKRGKKTHPLFFFSLFSQTKKNRDWFKGGLLKDLEYYRPFRSPVVKEPEPALA